MTFRAIQKIRSYVNVFQICQLYQHLWSLPSHQKSHQWSQQRQSQAEDNQPQSKTIAPAIKEALTV